MVLVTDYDMSEMNGLELIVHCHQIHPALKTVLLRHARWNVASSGSGPGGHRFGQTLPTGPTENQVAELLRV